MRMQESISIIKALADNSRLRLTNALIEKPQYVEELSERLNLAASTVSFHLKKLEKANLVYHTKEQYYVMYHMNHEAFGMTLQDLVSISDIEKAAQEERIRQYRRKVIRTFFENGKVPRMPAQQKKRHIILEEIATRFESERTYTEPEVNEIIAAIHEDFCLIRREFIETKLMARKNNKYRLLAGEIKPSLQPGTKKKDRQQMDAPKIRRKALKTAYLQITPRAGVFQVKNHANGKILLGSSVNVKATATRHRAELKLGSHRNPELQQDWAKYGPDQFSFDELEYLEEKTASTYDRQKDLAALEKRWLRKLQPYADKGYNRKPRKKP